MSVSDDGADASDVTVGDGGASVEADQEQARRDVIEQSRARSERKQRACACFGICFPKETCRAAQRPPAGADECDGL